MVSKGEAKFIIYPCYFDKALSRAQGRKVSKKHSSEKPGSEHIAKAATSLGLHPALEKNAAHPSTPWKKEGRVIVDKKTSKTKLLVQLSNRF